MEYGQQTVEKATPHKEFKKEIEGYSTGVNIFKKRGTNYHY